MTAENREWFKLGIKYIAWALSALLLLFIALNQQSATSSVRVDGLEKRMDKLEAKQDETLRVVHQILLEQRSK